MPIEINGVKLYGPAETAKILGTDVNMLRYYRNVGYIEGTVMATATYYTMEQIEAGRKVIAAPKKRGPKNRNKRDEEDTTSSVTYPSSSYSAAALGATA